ncbi:MAG: protein phosphatase CheZ [Thermodesulfobacteriota bacterium]
MINRLRKGIYDIADGKLSRTEIEQLIHFFQEVRCENPHFDEELFFKNLAYEMTGQVKELASLIIDFKKELKSKIHPELTDIAEKYIPEAADQLEDIIESTEKAANKILDNLEGMQADLGELGQIVDSLKNGLGGGPTNDQIKTDISAFLDRIKPHLDNSRSLISDSFIQMSFQDLTGQRIKRIITLVNEMEARIKHMIISFGIKLGERQKNPHISSDELQRAIDEKVTKLAGPQKEGKGLDQSSIDELLGNL